MLATVIHVVVLGFAATKCVGMLISPVCHSEFMLRFCFVIGAMVLLASLLLAIEAGLWAAAYLAVGVLPDSRSAMLYSLGAITSYGHVESFWLLAGD